MIKVTIAEAKIVREKYPDACIAKTRHKRYLEESLRYLRLIPNNFEAAQMLEAERRKSERKAKAKKTSGGNA